MSRDLQQAKSSLERAKAINVNVEAEMKRMISALNQAVIVIISIALVGVFTIISIAPTEQKLKDRALDQQEQITWQKQ